MRSFWVSNLHSRGRFGGRNSIPVVVWGSKLHSCDRFGGRNSIPVVILGVAPPFPWSLWVSKLHSPGRFGGRSSIAVVVLGSNLHSRGRFQSRTSIPVAAFGSQRRELGGNDRYPSWWLGGADLARHSFSGDGIVVSQAPRSQSCAFGGQRPNPCLLFGDSIWAVIVLFPDSHCCVPGHRLRRTIFRRKCFRPAAVRPILTRPCCRRLVGRLGNW